MNSSQLQAATFATRHAIRMGRWDSARPEDFPYYGFFDVDLFDCPQFVMFTANDCPRAINIFNRDFELHSMRLWCHLARSASCIVDVGAHVGVYSLAAAALRSDVAIHAFEPNPYAYARLRMHKEINGFGNIKEYRTALSSCDDNEEPLWWCTKKTSQISSGGHLEGHGNEFAITPTNTFDGYKINMGDRPLVKIDVEGHEVLVLAGMKDAIESYEPDIILETFSQPNCNEILEYILRDNYRFYRIREDDRRLEEMPTLLPASTKGKDYNAFLTTRPLPEGF